MIGFVIFCLSRLFCILFAPAQAEDEYKVHCQIKKASVYDMLSEKTEQFTKGAVYLYERIDKEILKDYMVKDGWGKSCEDFLMAQYNTSVTDDGIFLKYLHEEITLTLNEDPFTFYKDLKFDLEEFSCDFPVAEVTRGEKTLKDVSVIRAKVAEFGEWIFVALDGSEPRLIFPRRYVDGASLEFYDKKVSFAFEPNKKQIVVEFNKFAEAEKFYNFVLKPKLETPAVEGDDEINK